MIKRSYNDKLLILAHYMGFFIEFKVQQALGKKYFVYVGYSDVQMNDIPCGKADEPMTFEYYVQWNDFQATFEREFYRGQEQFYKENY